jgi:hypothetical protein
MANTDIKLMDDGDGWVKVEAGDLNVDGGTRRRKGNHTLYKRALVHDFNDGLTINWGSDYSGGVTIHGFVTVAEHLDVPGSTTLSGQTRLEGGFEAFGDARIEGKVQVTQLLINMTTTVMGPQRVPIPIRIQVDVGAELAALKKKIAELEEKVTHMV